MLRQIPGACMAARHASSALQAAASVSDKGVKVTDTPDLGDIVRVVGTHEWQRLAHCLIFLQHVQHLHVIHSMSQGLCNANVGLAMLGGDEIMLC